MKGSVVRISPPFGARAKLSTAGSMSAVARTGTTPGCTRSDDAAASIERIKFGLRRGVGIEHNRYTREAGRNLLEQIEPFAANRELGPAETGEVAAGLGQACNEALRDWIRDPHENDRDRAGGLPDDLQVDSSHGQNHIRHQPDQLRRVCLCECGIAGGPTNIDAQVLAFDPPQLPQSMH